jgi:hypothetical protein
MIQLASDPNASRTAWRPATAQGKGASLEAPRTRSSHAWPFISRHGEKPGAQEPAKNNHGDSGS